MSPFEPQSHLFRSLVALIYLLFNESGSFSNTVELKSGINEKQRWEGCNIKKFQVFSFILFFIILSKHNVYHDTYRDNQPELNEFEDTENNSSKNTKKVKKKYRRKIRLKSKSGEPLDLSNLKFNVDVS